MTVPSYCCRCCSSQSMLSASRRWLVGSSSRSTSGLSQEQSGTGPHGSAHHRRGVGHGAVARGQWRALIARFQGAESILSVGGVDDDVMGSVWRAMSLSILSGRCSTPPWPNFTLIVILAQRVANAAHTPSRMFSARSSTRHEAGGRIAHRQAPTPLRPA